MAYNFFDKKTYDGTVENKIMSNKESAKELNKPNIRKFEKRKEHSSFIHNICGGDLGDMQLISKFNKEFKCVIDTYSKCAWVFSLKYKKELQLLMLFKNFKINQNADQLKY